VQFSHQEPSAQNQQLGDSLIRLRRRLLLWLDIFFLITSAY
jgi:hypothetical protein